MSLLTRFRSKRNEQEEIILSLERFIQQIYWAEELTSKEVQKNVEESLVEIIYKNGRHASNGILITQNGYLLTANHCTKNLKGKRIRLLNGEKYKMKKVCDKNPEEDLALVKADIPKECKPMSYKFYNTNKIERIPIALLTIKDNKLIRKYGFTQKTYADGFSIDKISEPGDSGGIIISPNNRIMGFLAGTISNESAVIKLYSALDLIISYKRKIEKT
jgi:hypothetical protein